MSYTIENMSDIGYIIFYRPFLCIRIGKQHGPLTASFGLQRCQKCLKTQNSIMKLML